MKIKSCSFHIVAKANPGANIGDCIKDCIVAAIQEDISIELIHNDRLFRIDPSNLINYILLHKGEENGQKD